MKNIKTDFRTKRKTAEIMAESSTMMTTRIMMLMLMMMMMKTEKMASQEKGRYSTRRKIL